MGEKKIEEVYIEKQVEEQKKRKVLGSMNLPSTHIHSIQDNMLGEGRGQHIIDILFTVLDVFGFTLAPKQHQIWGKEVIDLNLY